MILVGYRHGLRVSELTAWQWDQVDLDESAVFVRRAKGSKSGMHTLERDEVNALRRLAPSGRSRSGLVFRSERGGPLSARAFRDVLDRAAADAGLPFTVHPHMLRHACGFELTRAGHPTRMVQEWLGHRNIQHTVRYTELDPGHFRRANLWGRG